MMVPSSAAAARMVRLAERRSVRSIAVVGAPSASASWMRGASESAKSRNQSGPAFQAMAMFQSPPVGGTCPAAADQDGEVHVGMVA